MAEQTPIANAIDAADRKARLDSACKHILANKKILAYILRDCTEEFRSCDIDDIAFKYIEGDPKVMEEAVAPNQSNNPTISGISTEDHSINEGIALYDIKFRAVAPADGKPVELIINVEAQNDEHPGYVLLKREIYYGCRLISSQNGAEFTGSNYDGIKKVYSIWIHLQPPGYKENSITRYHITIIAPGSPRF